MVLVEGSGTTLDDDLWRSLDIDSAHLVIGSILPDHSLSLEHLVEWKLDDLLLELVSLDEAVVDVLLVLHKEVDHGAF